MHTSNLLWNCMHLHNHLNIISIIEVNSFFTSFSRHPQPLVNMSRAERAIVCGRSCLREGMSPWKLQKKCVECWEATPKMSWLILIQQHVVDLREHGEFLNNSWPNSFEQHLKNVSMYPARVSQESTVSRVIQEKLTDTTLVPISDITSTYINIKKGSFQLKSMSPESNLTSTLSHDTFFFGWGCAGDFALLIHNSRFKYYPCVDHQGCCCKSSSDTAIPPYPESLPLVPCMGPPWKVFILGTDHLTKFISSIEKQPIYSRPFFRTSQNAKQKNVGTLRPPLSRMDFDDLTTADQGPMSPLVKYQVPIPGNSCQK